METGDDSGTENSFLQWKMDSKNEEIENENTHWKALVNSKEIFCLSNQPKK